MQTHETLFTPTEAAVLTGLSLKAVNNAIDKRTISVVAGEEGGRLLDARALLPLSAGLPIASRPSCGARSSMRSGNPRAMSCRLKAASSRSICVNPGESLQRRSENCAGPDVSSSSIPTSWAAILCFAARGCRCT